MVRRFSKQECVKLITAHFGNHEVSTKGMNRFYFTDPEVVQNLVYVSQTKHSEDGEGHWTYEFWHTLGIPTVCEILDGGGSLLLIDYINRRHCLLDTADIVWLVQHSSRFKGNDDEEVIDIVIREQDGTFFLKPYRKDVQITRTVVIHSL